MNSQNDSREMRKELRTMKNRVQGMEEPNLGDEEVDLIKAGLDHSNRRVRGRAIRTLKELPRGYIPYGAVKNELVQIIEMGIGSDDDQRKRDAENAARVLSKAGAEKPDRIDSLTGLGEEMVAGQGPKLTTGGCALLGPAVIFGQYDIPSEVVEDILKHVLMTDLMIESHLDCVDYLRPPFLILSCAVDNHGEMIAERLESIDLEPYVDSHVEKMRNLAVGLLEAVVEEHPNLVADYALPLSIRLTDDNPQTVLKSGRALSTLAEEHNPETARPALHTLDDALCHDNPPALAGALYVLDSIVGIKPEWVSTATIDRVESLRDDETISNEAPLRSHIVSILGTYANASESQFIDTSLIDFAFETLDVVDDRSKFLTSFILLQRNLPKVAAADPNQIMPVLVETADAGAPNLDDQSLPKIVSDDTDRASEPTERKTILRNLLTEQADAYRYLLAMNAGGIAAEEYKSVFPWLIDSLEDTDRSVEQRQLIGRMLRVAINRVDDGAEVSDQLEQAIESLQTADEEELVNLADTLR